MRNIPGRFFFCVEKAAFFETGTEGQSGQDKKRPGLLFFDMRGNQRRPALMERKPRHYLVTKHGNPQIPPDGPGEIARLQNRQGGLFLLGQAAAENTYAAFGLVLAG
jgi:hypothetical protein